MKIKQNFLYTIYSYLQVLLLPKKMNIQVLSLQRKKEET